MWNSFFKGTWPIKVNALFQLQFFGRWVIALKTGPFDARKNTGAYKGPPFFQHRF